jgi:hypothetical protein
MRRVRDLSIYILIGVVVATGGYWLALQKVPEDSLVRWGGLGMNTLALFGWVIKQYRRCWRNTVFWVTLGTLLIIHTAVFYLILKNVPQWRLAWYLLTSTAELIPVFATLDWTMDRLGTARNGKLR